jgi:hypothetical protein
MALINNSQQPQQRKSLLPITTLMPFIWALMFLAFIIVLSCILALFGIGSQYSLLILFYGIMPGIYFMGKIKVCDCCGKNHYFYNSDVETIGKSLHSCKDKKCLDYVTTVWNKFTAKYPSAYEIYLTEWVILLDIDFILYFELRKEIFENNNQELISFIENLKIKSSEQKSLISTLREIYFKIK